MAGFVIHQNKQTNNSQTKGSVVTTDTLSGVTLNIAEIAKHNKQTDCWMLINGKVYNITSYFGSHPGGNATMSATCGTDATSAYMTKDPNATTSGNRRAHSSRAVNLLSNYYIGDLNQTIGGDKITETASAVTSSKIEDEDYEYEDD